MTTANNNTAPLRSPPEPSKNPYGQNTRPTLFYPSSGGEGAGCKSLEALGQVPCGQ